MDEVIQYRKDQKAGGGRLVYKGVKLNNRTMHNFRPTIGTVNTYGIKQDDRRTDGQTDKVTPWAPDGAKNNKWLSRLTEVSSKNWKCVFPFCRTVRLNIQHLLCYPCCVINSKTQKSFLWQNTNLLFFNKCKLLVSSQFESIYNVRNDVF